MKEDNSEDIVLINSPFCVISPLDNQTYKVRQSNVMRDCSGETIAIMIQNSNIIILAVIRISNLPPSLNYLNV